MNAQPGTLGERQITTPITIELLRGALELERTGHGMLPHRLPAWARAQGADGQLDMAESQPSGVRLVFRTRAQSIELDTLPTKVTYRGARPRPDGVYDLLVDGHLAGQATASGGNTMIIDMASGTRQVRPGDAGTVRFTGLAAGMKDVEIWLPYNETTQLVALRTDAPVEAGTGRGSQGVAAPRQFDQPRFERREPHHHLAGAGRLYAAAWSWSIWAWAAAPCSTRSPPAPCATPPRT